jgi:hypothetical protein
MNLTIHDQLAVQHKDGLADAAVHEPGHGSIAKLDLLKSVCPSGRTSGAPYLEGWVVIHDDGAIGQDERLVAIPYEVDALTGVPVEWDYPFVVDEEVAAGEHPMMGDGVDPAVGVPPVGRCLHRVCACEEAARSVVEHRLQIDNPTHECRVFQSGAWVDIGEHTIRRECEPSLTWDWRRVIGGGRRRDENHD